jgi:hypothetical protein
MNKKVYLTLRQTGLYFSGKQVTYYLIYYFRKDIPRWVEIVFVGTKEECIKYAHIKGIRIDET